jgi:hypothetical protein
MTPPGKAIAGPVDHALEQPVAAGRVKPPFELKIA